MNELKDEKIDNTHTNELLEKLLENKDMQELAFARGFDEKIIRKNLVAFANYLERISNCKYCHGLANCINEPKGYRYDIDENLYDVLTPCRYLKEQAKKVSHKKNYLLCDLSETNLETSLSTIDLSNESKYYRNIVELLLEWEQKKEEFYKGYYINGGLGVGKSYLAACICNDLAKEGKKVAFVNFPKLCTDIRNSMTEKNYVSDKLKQMRNAYLLVIDDIGAENMTSYIRDDILFTTLDYRMENKKRTLFTSNCTLEKLQSRFVLVKNGEEDQIKAERVLERIKALINCELPMVGNSRRVKGTRETE